MCSLLQKQNNNVINSYPIEPYIFLCFEFSWWYVCSEYIQKAWGFFWKTHFFVYSFLLKKIYPLSSGLLFFLNVQIMNTYIWSCHKSFISIVQKNGRKKPARYDNTKSLGWDYIYQQNYFDFKKGLF